MSVTACALYGYPGSRRTVLHSQSECAACEYIRHSTIPRQVRAFAFVEMFNPFQSERTIRRVEILSIDPLMVKCESVTSVMADQEIANVEQEWVAKRTGQKEVKSS